MKAKKKEVDKYEKFATTIQRKLEGNVALLIGSGGSAPYGLPSMKCLSEEIVNKLNGKYCNDDSWKEFLENLKCSDNLEMALERVFLEEDIHNSIISTVWSLIDKNDRKAINVFLKTGTVPSLTKIIKKFVQRAGVTNVVTTNYDRLIEYAIDSSEGQVETGFSGCCIKSFNRFNNDDGKRIINLYKVHGSIDWFRNKKNYNIIATDFFSGKYSDAYIPMIVTPGNGKYKETHKEPFREVIAEADKALRKSSAYLCIGYGFNDEHIQPIIIDENRKNDKPIVIITKDVTSKMSELFLQDKSDTCLIVSKNPSGGSIINYSKDDKEVFDEDFWQIDLFYELWFE
ncbi:SIR2-like domain-containing protein [Propionispira arboris]|uniref:SIR2-like domain-containing protein n=1 Tax=Propionispira arboris TaxID=84035 RepID=A0A1H7D684_9FIRM|nr:SIR2 family protein [Propionispira arboris]SEJ96357.1 SIR2-like domain-containing protein [Propionispira arboris]